MEDRHEEPVVLISKAQLVVAEHFKTTLGQTLRECVAGGRVVPCIEGGMLRFSIDNPEGRGDPLWSRPTSLHDIVDRLEDEDASVKREWAEFFEVAAQILRG